MTDLRIDRLSKLATIGATMLVAFTASANPNFVASSSVETGAAYAELSIRFRCNVHYVDHQPEARGDQIHLRLEPTTVCSGAAPSVARSRELHRPVNADDAGIISIEYDGESPGNEFLRISFSQDVRFQVRSVQISDSINVRVFTEQAVATPIAPVKSTRTSRQVARTTSDRARYLINLESWRRPPATADLPELDLGEGRNLFVSEAVIDGVTWYRIRVGYFESAEQASRELANYRARFPNAWIDLEESQSTLVASQSPASSNPTALPAAAGEAGKAGGQALVAAGDDAALDAEAADAGDEMLPSRAELVGEAEELMQDARRAMTAGQLPRAVQIYTKILQMPANSFQPEAQEYLALARERNGQLAHAKAEYQRYLDVYPEGEGAERVRQRLAALLSGAAVGSTAPAGAGADRTARRDSPRPRSKWKLRTFLSQYYRRDVNQLNEQEEVISQSSLYTDASIDLRHRGERFDFSSRVTAGYRNNFLDEEPASSSQRNDFRLSYAFADLADAKTGLRGRLGRQTRNTGGVLGRFDGLNLTWELNERVRFETVTGNPVFSTAEDVERARLFYGLSSTFKPFSEKLELGVFALKQDFEGMTDRQSLGGEFRYFGSTTSVWGMVDYDTAFQEIGIAFVQGSWRAPGNFTLTALADHRRSPFLMLGNSVIGQLGEDLSSLSSTMTEDELRAIALDRSAIADTLTFGVSKPFTPRLQLNLHASIATISATPESAGVAATQDSTYSYYSADIVTSSLIKQGDVGIVGIRFATTETADIYSFNIDTRFPLGRTFRINPRIRFDYRENAMDQSTQWSIRPGLRLQYRWGRHMRLELEAGREFVQRDMQMLNQDRESYFVNLGYQLFY